MIEIAAVIGRNPKMQVTVGVEGVSEPMLLHFAMEDGVVQVSADPTVASRADPEPATAVLRDGELVLTPDAPLTGVAPGQTAVVYLGTRVLGQCTIDRTVSAVPARV